MPVCLCHCHAIAPTIFELDERLSPDENPVDVDRFSPDGKPEAGLLEKEEAKLDGRDDGKLLNPLENPPCPNPEDPCMWEDPCGTKDPPKDEPPPMYVGIGACIAFKFGANPLNGLSKGFKRSDIHIPFLLFLLFVDIFLFLVWIPSFFIVKGLAT